MNAKEEFLGRLDKIFVYRKRNERAPHKPLYLLLCIANLQRGLPRLQPFAKIDPVLKEALLRFGLATKSGAVSPQYPFWRLKNDGLAVVVPETGYNLRRSSDDPTKTSLLKLNAHGGLAESDYEILRNDLDLQTLAIHKILDGHFPRSIHEDIINYFGLRLNGARSCDENTDAEFRSRVLGAYEDTCAISGFCLRYRASSPGLEAAHVCWRQVGGNDDVCNGIAMTSLHRKLFHLGLFAFEDDYTIRVSSGLSEHTESAMSIPQLAGKKLRLPRCESDWPRVSSLRWHRRWVFRR